MFIVFNVSVKSPMDVVIIQSYCSSGANYATAGFTVNFLHLHDTKIQHISIISRGDNFVLSLRWN